MPYIKTWVPKDGKPVKFHVYVIHGVAEHSGRYDILGEALSAIGAKVICQDHKGHGKTAEAEGLPVGQFKDADPVKAIVNDSKEIILTTHQEKLPWLIFAHSGGCLYTEHVLNGLKGEACLETLRGVVFSGPPAIPSTPERVLFRILLNILVLLNTGQCIINGLTFGKYDKVIAKLTKKKLTMKNEWLNSDLEEVKKYNDDPFCAHDMSFKFWRSFLSHLTSVLSSSFLIPVSCPVLILGGDMDGATDYGRALDELAKRLTKRSQASAIEKLIYRGARHELLAEPIKELVVRKLVGWITDALVKA
jgi:alpha-beta hydrolase superfamily lysophospholipase